MERCIDDELPFEIPASWAWVRLGTVLEIARGGSPRPIQQYLTTESNGVNWIKIGDADKGGKYIYKTKEKICPEGVTKSRMVHSGDFLLTNSMSFGRPYSAKPTGIAACGLFLYRNPLHHRLDDRPEIPIQFRWWLLQPALDPPQGHLHETTADVVHKEVLRQVEI